MVYFSTYVDFQKEFKRILPSGNRRQELVLPPRLTSKTENSSMMISRVSDTEQRQNVRINIRKHAN
jgi:hypothetical protein